MKKDKQISFIIAFIFSLILVISISISFSTAEKGKHKYYDEMIAASNLTKSCFDAIKQYKIDHNIKISKYDRYQCGMIGELWSDITTTDGVIEAKLSACNPNFSAVYINMFSKLGLVEGDEVAFMFSGSFPTLNTAALCAAEVYGLKTVTMASIGASSFGANNNDFTYIDMVHHLNNIGIIHNDIDYISGGGHNDNGPEWWDEVKDDILDRLINNYHYEYINEPSYEKNVKLRTKLILEKCPNLKTFINVGAQTLSIGLNECSISENEKLIGIIKANNHSTIHSNNPNIGLIETFLNKSIDCIHMLQVKTLCINYGIVYNPDNIPNIGEGEVYYDVIYNLTAPIIGASINVVGIVLYFIKRKKLF